MGCLAWLRADADGRAASSKVVLAASALMFFTLGLPAQPKLYDRMLRGACLTVSGTTLFSFATTGHDKVRRVTLNASMIGLEMASFVIGLSWHVHVLHLAGLASASCTFIVIYMTDVHFEDELVRWHTFANWSAFYVGWAIQDVVMAGLAMLDSAVKLSPSGRVEETKVMANEACNLSWLMGTSLLMQLCIPGYVMRLQQLRAVFPVAEFSNVMLPTPAESAPEGSQGARSHAPEAIGASTAPLASPG
eukprot:TRINITY_DN75709_c0_g1_i1.p1 TRINITY_DN75709_c0_g1~~TRINITY_DN75709_c0_g1_i1.p1  ORF type:complete len:248 (-),score=27.88 TRINITY_DN75709_c0_g1_i1:146-889(-)